MKLPVKIAALIEKVRMDADEFIFCSPVYYFVDNFLRFKKCNVVLLYLFLYLYLYLYV